MLFRSRNRRRTSLVYETLRICFSRKGLRPRICFSSVPLPSRRCQAQAPNYRICPTITYSLSLLYTSALYLAASTGANKPSHTVGPPPRPSDVQRERELRERNKRGRQYSSEVGCSQSLTIDRDAPGARSCQLSGCSSTSGVGHLPATPVGMPPAYPSTSETPRQTP